jgi:FtsZ-interacting cell division protein ZipA
MEKIMIYVILALIIMVSIALWRTSRSTQKSEAVANNRLKPKAKEKKVRVQNEKPSKAPSQKKIFRSEGIDLRHSSFQNDPIALSDQALGLYESTPKNINLGEPVRLYLVADTSKPFVGESLYQHLLSTGLKLHKNGLFDRVYQTAHSTEILFRVASMKEPGSFPLHSIDNYQTHGLVFFMEPGNNPQVFKQRFDAMLSLMMLIESRLGGHIFTPEKTLLEKQDFNRYADYLVNLEEAMQEA